MPDRAARLRRGRRWPATGRQGQWQASCGLLDQRRNARRRIVARSPPGPKRRCDERGKWGARPQAAPRLAYRAGHSYCRRVPMPLARCVAVVLLMVLTSTRATDAEIRLYELRLPPGFSIELLAHVPNARQMALGDDRILYVGSMREGKVHALQLDEQYRAGKLHVVASGLNMPVGVAYRQGSLYISAVDRILRLDGISQRLADPPAPVVVTDKLPKEGHHGWKFIAFGPDGWLYVPVGAPCNICETDPDRYAAILRMQPDGSQLQTYARGVRNTVGFDWQPGTHELWFTDNGRDMMGDDVPPAELHHAPRAGLNFGYPYCHGAAIPDPEF